MSNSIVTFINILLGLVLVGYALVKLTQPAKKNEPATKGGPDSGLDAYLVVDDDNKGHIIWVTKGTKVKGGIYLSPEDLEKARRDGALDLTDRTPVGKEELED